MRRPTRQRVAAVALGLAICATSCNSDRTSSPTTTSTPPSDPAASVTLIGPIRSGHDVRLEIELAGAAANFSWGYRAVIQKKDSVGKWHDSWVEWAPPNDADPLHTQVFTIDREPRQTTRFASGPVWTGSGFETLKLPTLAPGTYRVAKIFEYAGRSILGETGFRIS